MPLLCGNPQRTSSPAARPALLAAIAHKAKFDEFNAPRAFRGGVHAEHVLDLIVADRAAIPDDREYFAPQSSRAPGDLLRGAFAGCGVSLVGDVDLIVLHRSLSRSRMIADQQAHTSA